MAPRGCFCLAPWGCSFSLPSGSSCPTLWGCSFPAPWSCFCLLPCPSPCPPLQPCPCPCPPMAAPLQGTGATLWPPAAPAGPAPPSWWGGGRAPRGGPTAGSPDTPQCPSPLGQIRLHELTALLGHCLGGPDVADELQDELPRARGHGWGAAGGWFHVHGALRLDAAVPGDPLLLCPLWQLLRGVLAKGRSWLPRQPLDSLGGPGGSRAGECRQLCHRTRPGLREGAEGAQGGGAPPQQGRPGRQRGQRGPQGQALPARHLHARPAENKREETPLQPGPSGGTPGQHPLLGWWAWLPSAGRGRARAEGLGQDLGVSPSDHRISSVTVGFTPPSASGEAAKGGHTVSTQQPPAQPRVRAAVGCWPFAGRSVPGPLTTLLLRPGSRRARPTL